MTTVDVTAELLTPPVQRALARSVLYRLLAHSLAYPDAQTLVLLKVESLSEMSSAIAWLPRRVATPAKALVECLSRVELPELENEYRRLFTHVTSPDCPLYETTYSAQHIFQLSQTLADIAGFYRAFGLDSSDTQRERVDHASIELEFMSFLAYKEAYARVSYNTAGVRICRHAQRRFLESHLGRWLPICSRRLEVMAGQGVYREIARTAKALIEADVQRFRARPRELEETIPITDLSESEAPCGEGDESCPAADL